MKTNRKTHCLRILCALLALLTVFGMTSGLLAPVRAAQSQKILTELQKLREEQSGIQKKRTALSAEIAENKKQTQSVVEQKSDIDRQIELSNETIDNYNAQIQQYSLLIAEKQKELDEAELHETQLQEQYKARLRSMEETGTVSYWSILFKASSFSDLLDRVDMIHEIAKSDQLMMKKLSEATEAVQQSREELEQEQQQMQTARDELAAQEAELEMQRAEADALLLQIAEECEKMTAEYQGYLAQEDALSKQVAKAEKDYYQALAKEEAARLAELNKQNNYVPANKDSSGFLYPLPYRVAITDSYGYRTHPVTGKKTTWHNGVDLAAGAGTAIYATKSGTVTTALRSDIWGNYVVINHGDGFSSLYAHMQGLIVKAGDYVKQGQTIGYVGSTGLSTGPHLHFTIYYNGADVNPMSYIG
jgi:murein DD-endopeptidase MepM/ murein hydrolase activator NlpD